MKRTVSETSYNNERVDDGGHLTKPLGVVAFAMMGVGTIVATGIFSFLPYIYSFVTGPAVIVSLLFAAGRVEL